MGSGFAEPSDVGMKATALWPEGCTGWRGRGGKVLRGSSWVVREVLLSQDEMLLACLGRGRQAGLDDASGSVIL